MSTQARRRTQTGLERHLDVAVSCNRLFRVTRNGLIDETATVRRVMPSIRTALPNGWSAHWRPPSNPAGRIDGRVVVTAPGGQSLTFAAQAKRTYRLPAPKTVGEALQVGSALGMPPLLLVDYANKAIRTECEAQGVSYADATGWVTLNAAGPPGLYVKTQGALRSPVVRDGSINRLDGPGASRVIRTLWDLNDGPLLPRGVRELAREAGVSPGTVSKVLPALESFGAIERDGFGRILKRDRRLLLERWVQDYRFTKSNARIEWFLAPRGIDPVRKRIPEIPDGAPLGMTGPQVAIQNLRGQGKVPVIPLTLLAYYTADIDGVAAALDLRVAPHPGAANVVLAEPRDAAGPDLLAPFDRTRGSVKPVPLSQALADLMTLGGRYPELADQLFDELKLDRQ